MDSIHTTLIGEDRNLKEIQEQKNDSLALMAQNHFNATDGWYKNFLYQYIDTTKSPIVALFAFSYSQEIGIDKATNRRVAKKIPKTNFHS